MKNHDNMKIPKILILLLFTYNFSLSQEKNMVDTNAKFEIQEDNAVWESRRNILKFIPTSLVVGNFQFQYERVLNRKFSIALGYSMIPEGDFPFKDLILEKADDEGDVGRYINNASLQYSSFTPELRVYFGDGYGKGFYLAPFYRHSKYSVRDVQIYYDGDDGVEQQMNTNGDLTTDTFGLLLGVQFNLGSRLTLDWFILGPNYGFSNGDLLGVAEQPFTASEQQDLNNELADIDLPIGDFTYEVNSQGAKIKIDGPWAGIRAGIALGFRF